MANNNKYHLVINALPAQDNNRFRGIGVYTIEFIKNLIDLWNDNSELVQPFSQITLVCIKEPEISAVLGKSLGKINTVVLPVKSPHQRLLHYLYYALIQNPALNNLFEKIRAEGEKSVYFLPKHMILSHRKADYSVIMTHDIIPLMLNHFSNKRYLDPIMKIEYMQYIKQMKKADLIVTNSKDSAKNVGKYINRENDIVPIYLGSRFYEEADKLVNAKRLIPEKYFVYYGGYDYDKNIPGILASFQLLIKDHTELANMKLVMVGGLNHKTRLDKLISEYDLTKNIILEKTLSEIDLTHYLVFSQGLFRLSRAEGFGLPELEAMSIGVPVISSNIGPIKELFNGQIIIKEVDDYKGIADSLYKLSIGEVNKNMIEEAKKYARSFTWRKMTETSLKVIGEYLKNNQ